MLVQSSPVRLASLALLVCIACGSKVEVDDGNGGSGGDGGGGEGGSGGNVDPQCLPFKDAEPVNVVEVMIRNESGQDVYLPANCGQRYLEISAASGDLSISYGSVEGSCLQTCDDLQREEPIFCEAGACAPSSIRIAPGAVISIEWDGRGLAGAEMPAACWFSESAGTSCSQVVNAPDGAYDIGVRGFPSCGEGCECEDVDGAGVCNGDVSGFEVPVSGSVTFPSSEEPQFIELVFESCAFGCPG